MHALGYSLADGPFTDGPDTVYRGFHLASGDEVALRLVRPGFDSKRFHQDAAVLTTFQHPGVANLREHRVVGGWSLLVLDWIEGETLERFMERRQSVSIEEAMHLGEQLSAALDSLHSAGVVHPDFGPRSVVSISGSGPRPDVKIIDLAICRKNASSGLGSAAHDGYGAPELSGVRVATAATDQFLVATLMQELITGLSPFPNGDFVATPIRKLKPLASEALESALLRALSIKPEDRFDTMLDFIAAARGGREQAPEVPAADSVQAPKTAKKDAKAARKEARAAKKAQAKVAENKKTDTSQEKSQDPGKNGSLEFVKATAAIAIGALLVVGGYLTFFSGEGEATTREISTPEVQFEATAANAGEDPILLELDAWEAGFAESISCNAVGAAGFEAADLPVNFYGDPANPNRDQIVAGAGVDGSGALEVGDPGGVGIYGEALPAEPATSYLVSVHFSLAGEVDEAQLSIEWLNGDRDVIAESEILDLTALDSGQHALISRDAPEGTEWAVPRIFKGAGPGLLFVDELVFVQTESECTAAILG